MAYNFSTSDQYSYNILFYIDLFKITTLLLAITTSTVSAEVFKCKSSTGATEYRPTPCSAPGVQQAVVDIKPMNSQQEEQRRLDCKRGAMSRMP